jgi:L-amino acid N-acyltransferase YncA
MSSPGTPDAPARTLRPGMPQDAAACLAIYAPYVRETVVSFEEEPPTVAQMRVRIEQSSSTHAWVVLEEQGRVVGYAYAGPYKARSAYRWACEVSVYLEPGRRRTGAGRALYDALFARLVERGFLTAVAGMTLPNPASEGLHRAMGFEDVGTWRRIGWKAGAWHDVHWMQRPLSPAGFQGPPTEPA